MKKCEVCGASKPADALICPACLHKDEDVFLRMVAGTPSLTLLIIGMVCLWIYRFWYVGWAAWAGNLRFAAICAVTLGFVSLFGPLWTFGIRNRKTALIVLIITVPAFLFLNSF